MTRSLVILAALICFSYSNSSFAGGSGGEFLPVRGGHCTFDEAALGRYIIRKAQE